MEENEIITNQEAQVVQQNETQNYLYVQSKAYVKEAGKWMHFMAIILAIGIGLVAIAPVLDAEAKTLEVALGDLVPLA